VTGRCHPGTPAAIRAGGAWGRRPGLLGEREAVPHNLRQKRTPASQAKLIWNPKAGPLYGEAFGRG
jgi:hypothetical protein